MECLLLIFPWNHFKALQLFIWQSWILTWQYCFIINLLFCVHKNVNYCIFDHSFQDFDVQTSAWCSSDWLTIGTRKSIEGTRVCGSSIPAPFISSKGHVWIEFHSDDRYTGKGFRLSYVIGMYSVGVFWNVNTGSLL